MSNVILTNAVLSNGGDAAIAESLLRLLRQNRDSLSVRILDSDPDSARDALPGEDVGEIFFKRFLNSRSRTPWTRGVTWLRRARVRSALGIALSGGRQVGLGLLRSAEREYVEALSRASLVVSTGGTYLVPTYPLWPRLVELELAAVSGTPYVLFTQSLGPFPARLRRRIRRVCRMAEYVMVRDAASAAHLADIGIHANVCIYPDVVFSLATVDSPRLLGGPLRVAVSVREWKLESEERSAYLTSVASAVQYLVEQRSANVTFVSSCQGDDRYWADDAAVAAEVIQMLPATLRDRVTLVDRKLSTAELLDIYEAQHAVIATRMHVAILALCRGVPVLAIAYEFKTTELFGSLGFADWTVQIDRMDPASFRDLVDRFVSEADELRPQLGYRVTQLGEEARASIAPILRLLDQTAR